MTPQLTVMAANTGVNGVALAVLIVLFLLVLLRMSGFVGQVQRQARELADVAMRDDLTGLPNRRRFERDLGAALRAGRRPVVALLDLNGFKVVNDQLGHDVGDQLLVAVGQRLCAGVEQGALVARMGGDEFAVLLEDRPLLIRAVTWATINWLLDAASLWVFVAAFSHFISPIDLLVAYGLANILAAIPITPGGLGVVEGNGGLLRPGLPMQSVSDGEWLVHEPLRLSVLIEAPREAITDVLERHPAVRVLFDNKWLHLFALDEAGRMAWRYAGDLQWKAADGTAASKREELVSA